MASIETRRATNWCATFYDMAFADTLKTWGPDGTLKLCTYMVWENEICPRTQRPHLQFYCCFKARKRLSELKKLHRTAHWLPCNGTAEENRTYCTKDFEAGVEGCVMVELGDIAGACAQTLQS